MLQVDKRGRFITNMGFANFVTAAVDSDDPRIKGSCMVILEEDDPGIFDRGTPTTQARPPALLHPRPDLQPEGSRQPHHRRLHRQGRRHRPELQPRRNHRSRLPPHARHGRRHDLGQAALRRRAGHPLPARPLPRRRAGHARHRRATNSACSRRRTCCTGWWTSGPPAKPAPRSASPPRALFDELDPLEKREGPYSCRAGITGGARADESHARKPKQDALEAAAVPGRQRDPSAPDSKADPLVQFAMLDSRGQRPLPGLQALEHRPRRAT